MNPRADLRSASPFETEEDKRDDSSDEEEEKNVPTIEDDSDDHPHNYPLTNSSPTD